MYFFGIGVVIKGPFLQSSVLAYNQAPSPRDPQACNLEIMNGPDLETETRLRTLPLDDTLLVLHPKEEAFFKSETGIQDTEELRKHILRIQEDAYKVSRCSRTDQIKSVTLYFVFRPTRILAFGGSDSRRLGSPGRLHIQAFLDWQRTGQVRYF